MQEVVAENTNGGAQFSFGPFPNINSIYAPGKKFILTLTCLIARLCMEFNQYDFSTISGRLRCMNALSNKCYVLVALS